MTCPKCLTHNAEPIESWTISGRKMTIPLLRLWACLNRDCRHQWPREFASSTVTLASPACSDRNPRRLPMTRETVRAVRVGAEAVDTGGVASIMMGIPFD